MLVILLLICDSAIRDSLRLGKPDCPIKRGCILEGELVVYSSKVSESWCNGPMVLVLVLTICRIIEFSLSIKFVNTCLDPVPS